MYVCMYVCVCVCVCVRVLPQRSVCRLPGKRTSRRNFAPFTSSTNRAVHSQRSRPHGQKAAEGEWLCDKK